MTATSCKKWGRSSCCQKSRRSRVRAEDKCAIVHFPTFFLPWNAQFFLHHLNKKATNEGKHSPPRNTSRLRHQTIHSAPAFHSTHLPLFRKPTCVWDLDSYLTEWNGNTQESLLCVLLKCTCSYAFVLLLLCLFNLRSVNCSCCNPHRARFPLPQCFRPLAAKSSTYVEAALDSRVLSQATACNFFHASTGAAFPHQCRTFHLFVTPAVSSLSCYEKPFSPGTLWKVASKEKGSLPIMLFAIAADLSDF